MILKEALFVHYCPSRPIGMNDKQSVVNPEMHIFKKVDADQSNNYKTMIISSLCILM